MEIKTMTLYDFIALDEMEQAEAVWSGVHIADRKDEEHRILLYQMNSLEGPTNDKKSPFLTFYV